MANGEKIYIGNGKEKVFDGGGSLISVVLDVEAVARYAGEYGFTANTTGKRKIKLNVGRRREADQYGNTHHVTVDTWRPDGAGSTGNAVPTASVPAAGGGHLDDEIPF